MPGVQELVIILIIIVVLFGASRLPQLGRGMGEGIRNFKRGLRGGDNKESLDEAKAPTSPDEQA